VQCNNNNYYNYYYNNNSNNNNRSSSDEIYATFPMLTPPDLIPISQRPKTKPPKSGKRARRSQLLEHLFQSQDGFEELMVIIANNLLRDNKFGMIFRVSVGAALSTVDAATDIYVITTYYQSDALIGQAHALLAMITTNLAMQILVVLVQ